MSIEIIPDQDGNFHCIWGSLDNSEADPSSELRHLMLTTGDYVQYLVDNGPQPGPRGGYHSITIDGERIFAHLNHGGRTTWELFEAHFWDGNGPDDVMIGRWPD